MESAPASEARSGPRAARERPWALLDRDREVASLERLVSDARRGAGRILLVEGPPGIGKTRLLREAGRAAREQGLTVAAARGTELERPFPFGIVHQLLDSPVRAGGADERAELMSGAAALARPLFEAAPTATLGDPSPTILHGLYWLIANLAERRPLLLAIDDAHWADRPSGRLLDFLIPRLEGVPVAVVVAGRRPRADEGPDVLEPLTRAPLERLVLNPLSDEAVESLVLGRLPDAPDGLGAACAGATRGSPFLLHHLLEEMVLRRRDGGALDPAAVQALGPLEVAGATLARVRDVPGAAALARAVAVLGDDADLHAAAALAGLDPDQASTVADRLAAATILDRLRPLRFVHPIVRAAVYEAIPTAERSDLHAGAVRLHAEAGADPDVMATHLLKTEPRGDRATVDALRAAAAASSARGAPEPATEFLRRALEEPPPAEAGPGIMRELGSALMRSGLPEAREALYDAFVRAPSPVTKAAAAADLAEALMHAGRSPAAVTVVETVLDEPGGLSPGLIARFEGLLLGNAFVGVSGRALVERRLTAAASEYTWTGDERSRLLVGPVAWEWAIGPSGSAQRAGDLATRGWEDDWLIDHETADSTLAVGAANALWLTGRYAQAEAALSALVADAQRRGSVRGFAITTANRAYARLLRGRLREAEADAEAYLHPLAQSGWPIFDGTVAAIVAMIKLEQGDLDAAERALAGFDGVRDADTGTTQWVNLARAAIASVRGRHAEALSDLALCREFEAGFGGGPGVACLVPWRSSAALIRGALGEPDKARRLAAEEVELAREYGAPRPLGVALRALGAVEQGDRRLEALDEAVTVLEGADSEVELSRALTDLGAALRQSGDRAQARRRLESAMDLAHRRGALAIARHARDELVAAGARPRRLATSGPDSLTASERRVATMAAGGMANREIAQALFVTQRTVEGHLSNAFAKLGVQSRAELAGTLAPHDTPAG